MSAVEQISDAALDEARQRAIVRGEIVLTDVGVSAAQLAQLIDELPGQDGRPSARLVNLGGSVITGFCDLANLTVTGWARFDGTRFEHGLDCSDTRFEQSATFRDTVFAPDATVLFARAAFLELAYFRTTRFGGDTVFARSRFAQDALFVESTFERAADFTGARFEAAVELGRVTVAGDLSLFDASFERARQLGPLRIGGSLSLDRSSFDAPVRIEVAAQRVTCEETRFRAGMDLRARWAEIAADGADFSGSSLITDLPPPSSAEEPAFLGFERPDGANGWAVDKLRPPLDYTPRMTSLRGAKVAELTLACIDLRPCSFATAHGLDRMRIERGTLAQPPAPGFRLHHPWWTRRQTIAEEHRWRAAGHGAGWVTAEVTPTLEPRRRLSPPQPAQIAGIYRSLRKGREDSKDEPGAADFYYGEMEMRRHRTDAPRLERLTLTVYWLVSGYGMRAGRALAALLLTLAILAIPLDLGGFPDDRSYAGAVLYAVESSISLLRAPVDEMTAGGEVVTIALRILGPLLFGLAALALRSRVKR